MQRWRSCQNSCSFQDYVVPTVVRTHALYTLTVTAQLSFWPIRASHPSKGHHTDTTRTPHRVKCWARVPRLKNISIYFSVMGSLKAAKILGVRFNNIFLFQQSVYWYSNFRAYLAFGCNYWNNNLMLSLSLDSRVGIVDFVSNTGLSPQFWKQMTLKMSPWWKWLIAEDVKKGDVN